MGVVAVSQPKWLEVAAQRRPEPLPVVVHQSHRRRAAACRSKPSDDKDSSALRSLDALLGGEPTVPDRAAGGGGGTPALPAASQQPAGPAESGQEGQKAGQKGQGEEGYFWWDRPGSQEGPLRTRGMQGPDGSEYIDSERFTRDMLQLSASRRREAGEGGPLPLPGDGATPVVSRALAAATLVAGGAGLAGLLPPLVMDSAEVAAGASWRLLTASLQPISALNLLASVAALSTAGAYAEQRLGSLLFGGSYLLAGATCTVVYYAAAAVVFDGTATAGAGPALLGPSAALLACLAANWRVLGSAQARGRCLAAAAGLAAVLGTELELLAPVYALSGLVGLVLGLVCGPQFEVLRELDIQAGSMTISGDEEEVEVVVDRRTQVQRVLVLAAVGLALAAAVASVDGLVRSGALQWLLLEEWGSPEVQLELFEEMGPDAWDLNA